MTQHSPRRRCLLAAAVALSACGAQPMSAPAPAADAAADAARDAAGDGAADAPPEAAADAVPPAEPAEGRAFRLLLGRFDSAIQSLADPRFFSIRVEACRVSAPALGGRVLYLEQSRTGMAPYRQRVYVLERDGADDRAVSRVFELNSPSEHVGLCADPSRVTFTPDDVVERAGCAVHLTARDDGFAGGTEGRGCESTLMGASYATSEVELRANGFTSLDRGFDGADRQVWGSTAGPYRFTRRTPVEP